jgi:uncharacterized lipoprotein YddW (UPF0748 family)
MNSFFRSPSAFLMVLLAALPATAAPLIIDDFEYATTTAARQAWSGTSGPAVTMETNGAWGSERVMQLTCDFATRSTRCYWDRTVSLNLANYTEVALEVYAPNPSPISYFTLYFKSGSGWYGASAALTQTGWQTLRFSLSEFTSEGTPAGWDQISGIRLSPWKAAAQDTYLAARQLRAFTPTVLLVRDTASSNPDVVNQTIERHLDWLGGYNVDCGAITRAGVEAGLLTEYRLAILPYNESVSETEMTRLESFVAGGGKVIAYYLLPGRLPALLGVRVTGWKSGDYAAWKFVDTVITNLPSRVVQDSWNITLVTTNGTLNSRVVARWEDSLGQDTGSVAWLGSDHGFYLSHILLADDADQKSYALLCLIGSILPEVWTNAVAGAINDIGRVGPYLAYSNAVPGIRQQGAATLRSTRVETELAAAEIDRTNAVAAQASGQYSQAISYAHSARSHLRQAYTLCLKPVYPEFRAIWEHHATGPYPGDWGAGVAALASNHFTAIFPNMLWGGLAHYNSAYLPHSDEYNLYGDQIAACVTAAHARGLQVHVWKVNWNLSGAPQTFIDTLRAAGRTQVSSSGTNLNWLCPSSPDNFALETNSMLEVVRNYDVDGIHFDYIRYPGSESCYCTNCGARFQSQSGLVVTNWPADVLATGSLRTSFLDWRRAQITRLVQAVYTGTKALKPAVKVSAAVFPDAPSAYNGVGQDWRLWVTNGILDFICPMDYTTELHSFTNLVGQQLSYVDGRIPVYPGIGAYVLENDATLAQIEVTRAANTGGFIVFELSPASATGLLPAMGLGATAPDEPDTDGDLLPDSWELHWFGNLTSAGQNTDSNHPGITDHAVWILGTDPTSSAPGVLLSARQQTNEVQISFLARAAEGIGYQNAVRHYCLETATAPTAGAAWTPVSGFENRTQSTGTQELTCKVAAPSGARFYRLRIWLEAP